MIITVVCVSVFNSVKFLTLLRKGTVSYRNKHFKFEHNLHLSSSVINLLPQEPPSNFEPNLKCCAELNSFSLSMN